MGNERRFVPGAELRVGEAESGGPVIAGYAVLYNQRSNLLWDFYEEIAPGAFGDSLTGDVRALWQHDSAQVLGRTKSGTLRLWEDERGVAFELQPPETQLGRDAVASIRRGDVDQMSFGFWVAPQGERWDKLEDGTALRTVVSGSILEVSPVTWAAYPQTTVGVRNDEIYGAIPVIPAELRAQEADTEGDERARARLDVRHKLLRIIEMED